jgi:5-methylcytosine-specific restriction protein A
MGDGRPTEEVDHILPKSQGGTDDRANLQGLCRTHHSAKTMRESVRTQR